ncbi:hypothetical protein H9W90_01260 [Polaribacter pectinis]|uniref:Glycosyltransferase 2-like domain-containing protein n=1 Tax=Polaribacter pectinis TaxID=2738844 RepID=A0A7G9LAX8_9FLAO|nr:hypothetical protein [Polaribacter pectinis]QNM85777.1 hypothetical protein H9W90_01260 [Polaribacter pectinis]
MIVTVFHNIYSKIENKNKFLVKIKFYAFVRFSVRLFANGIIPLIFRCFPSSSLQPSVDELSPKIIVSLTTFPARIGRIWIVVESILRQKIKPDKIILWLSAEQFKDINRLPKKLKSFQKKGLEIRLCDEDLRSHKKYYYAFKEYPNDTIITVDDDLFYPETLIEDLINLNKLYPKTISCNRAFKIISNTNDILLPYNKWNLLKEEMGPSSEFFYTTGGGTLFPPNTLYNEVLNKDVFMKYCLLADDVWLNLMSQLNKTKVSKLGKKSILLPILNTNNMKLSTLNLEQNLNDKQISDVRKYFIKSNNKDPFSFYFQELNNTNC